MALFNAPLHRHGDQSYRRTSQSPTSYGAFLVPEGFRTSQNITPGYACNRKEATPRALGLVHRTHVQNVPRERQVVSSISDL